MAKTTKNIGLTLPDKTEPYDIALINNNTEKIDDAMGRKADIGANGQVLAEQLQSITAQLDAIRAIYPPADSGWIEATLIPPLEKL